MRVINLLVLCVFVVVVTMVWASASRVLAPNDRCPPVTLVRSPNMASSARTTTRQSRGRLRARWRQRARPVGPQLAVASAAANVGPPRRPLQRAQAANSPAPTLRPALVAVAPHVASHTSVRAAADTASSSALDALSSAVTPAASSSSCLRAAFASAPSVPSLSPHSLVVAGCVLRVLGNVEAILVSMWSTVTGFSAFSHLGSGVGPRNASTGAAAVAAVLSATSTVSGKAARFSLSAMTVGAMSALDEEQQIDYFQKMIWAMSAAVFSASAFVLARAAVSSSRRETALARSTGLPVLLC
jgi:hypothetical protein